jgi:hypothetical protein
MAITTQRGHFYLEMDCFEPMAWLLDSATRFT